MTEPATIPPLIRDNLICKPVTDHGSTLQEPGNLEDKSEQRSQLTIHDLSARSHAPTD